MRETTLGQMEIRPVSLAGRFVRLEPLSTGHLDALVEVGLDPEIWRWTTARVETREDLERWIDDALRAQRAGLALPFATIELQAGRVVGSSRFMAIERAHRRVEIGWTWVSPAWQRTAVNTEAKLLMLEHAFERWGCHRVEFKTDALNERSRTALTRLGAIEEGTFRKHMEMPGGRLRDSVYFSVVEDEWPELRARLRDRLDARATRAPS